MKKKKLQIENIISSRTLLQSFADWVAETGEQKYRLYKTHKIFLIERLEQGEEIINKE